MSKVVYIAPVADPVTPTTVYGRGHEADVADEAHVRALINSGRAALMGAAIRRLRVDAVAATTAVIRYTLDRACTNQKADYGTTAAYGSSKAASPASGPGDRIVTLTGLTPATLYHFCVSVTLNGAETRSVDKTFTTTA